MTAPKPTPREALRMIADYARANADKAGTLGVALLLNEIADAADAALAEEGKEKPAQLDATTSACCSRSALDAGIDRFMATQGATPWWGHPLTTCQHCGEFLGHGHVCKGVCDSPGHGGPHYWQDLTCTRWRPLRGGGR